jgi:4'-phosphopantetheinyl transferase EntD
VLFRFEFQQIHHASEEKSLLFPDGVEVVEIVGAVDIDQLMGSERECIRNASPNRQREFAAGRLCARRALGRLGKPSVALPMMNKLLPLWPDGIVGSISHTDGYCVAAVGLGSQLISIGIDAERAGKIERGIWPLIFVDDEIKYLESIEDVFEQELKATTIFSAKEAFYKCQYPITQTWVEFRDVAVRFDEWGFYLEVFQRGWGVPGIDKCRGLYFWRNQLVVCGIAMFKDSD